MSAVDVTDGNLTPNTRVILLDNNGVGNNSPMALTSSMHLDDDSSNSHDGGDGDNLGVTAAGMPQTMHLSGLHPESGAASQAGLQTVSLSNCIGDTPEAATIVQYAQAPDGQIYIPMNMAGSNVQYQLASTAAMPQQLVRVATKVPTMAHGTEEAVRKRELRLLKNGLAARECRRKKKEYIQCLENRVAILENQNKSLIEELNALKELYCEKEG